MTRLETCFARIDEANALDLDRSEGAPAALLYGRRMIAELDRHFPDAADPLRIAARGQHIERWVLRRGDYPEGRTGYLKWRTDLAAHHARRIGEIMSEAGYSHEEIERAARMIRKEGIKSDTEVQALEDVICFTFLKWYFIPFSEKHTAEKIDRIVAKTARKMSTEARARVLLEFDLPEALARHFQD